MIEIDSLKSRLKHVRDHWSSGPKVQCIDARSSTWFESNAPRFATRPAIKRKEGNIVTDEENKGEVSGI